ncbi:MAG: hypothetical protein PVF26_14075 [Desulfobacterales bacterium]
MNNNKSVPFALSAARGRAEITPFLLAPDGRQILQYAKRFRRIADTAFADLTSGCAVQ